MQVLSSDKVHAPVRWIFLSAVVLMQSIEHQHTYPWYCVRSCRLPSKAACASCSIFRTSAGSCLLSCFPAPQPCMSDLTQRCI